MPNWGEGEVLNSFWQLRRFNQIGSYISIWPDKVPKIKYPLSYGPKVMEVTRLFNS